MTDPKRFQTLLGHALLATAGIFLLVLAGYEALRGLNHYVTAVLEKRLSEWQKATVSATAEEQESLLAAMDRFVFPSAGGKGDVELEAARAELRWLQEGMRSRVRRQSSGPDNSSLDGFREVLRLRPAWGKGWARFAQVKAAHDGYDEELSFALAFATQQAPREQDVLAMVVTSGFSVWDNLGENSKELVWNTARTAMEDTNFRGTILRQAKDVGLADYIQTFDGKKVPRTQAKNKKGRDGVLRNPPARYQP